MPKSIKAESLLFLKSIGLAPEPLLVIERLPNKRQFYQELKKSGFKNNQEIGVRFSYAGLMEIPRSVGLRTFDEIYKFIKKYFQAQSAVIIHPFIPAKYVGTLSFQGDKILVNLIKSGIWEPNIAKNCDIFFISNKKITVYLYQKKRIGYIPKEKILTKKQIKPLSIAEISKIIKIFIGEWDKLEQLNKFNNLILEFIITPNNKFVGMELEHGSQGIDYKAVKELDLFKVNKYADINKWDKKKDLLLALTVFREEKDKFLELINKIKPHKKEIFVEYGLLSHPAILMREQGLKTKPYINYYKKIDINFRQK